MDVSTWHFPRWIRPIVVGGGERDRRDRLGREFFLPSLMFLLHFSYGVRMQSEDHFRLIKAKSEKQQILWVINEFQILKHMMKIRPTFLLLLLLLLSDLIRE